MPVILMTMIRDKHCGYLLQIRRRFRVAFFVLSAVIEQSIVAYRVYWTIVQLSVCGVRAKVRRSQVCRVLVHAVSRAGLTDELRHPPS